MANANKAKGTRWESDVRNYLRDLGIPAYRPAPEGRLDVGDIHGIDPFVGQAKDWKDIVAALRVGLDGANQQAASAGRDYGVNFVKRARAGTARGYAVLDIETFGRVLKRLQAAETSLAWAAPAQYAQHQLDHSRSRT